MMPISIIDDLVGARQSRSRIATSVWRGGESRRHLVGLLTAHSKGWRLDDRALAVFDAKVAGGDRRVVLEEHQRIARRHLLHEALLRVERLEREQIESHDPRVVDVR